VFLDAEGLSTEEMQSVARELNFSESTFVLPRSRGRWPVRIFTPRIELPFAGHPTLGTAAALAHEGLVSQSVTLEQKAGPVDVAIEKRAGSWFCEMSLERKVDLAAEAPDRRAVAAALSIEAGAIRDAFFAGVGARFCFAEVADRTTVDAAAVDRAAFKALANAWSANVFLFAREADRLHARLFAPAAGIEEDPATGSAAAALAARFAVQNGEASFRIEQGVAMGRPSFLRAAATRAGEGIARVLVGGGCRVFATAEML
jgi:trans-2,3-dihydro-3-hydroxyanthranilate isomerase